MEVLKSLNLKTPILLIKALNDGKFGVIDSRNTLRIFDTVTYAIVGGFKSSIVHERIYGSHVDMTPDGAYSISMIPGGNNAALFNVPEKALLFKVGRHQGEIESVGIDPNGRYCVTCGQDGKAFSWVLKTNRMAFSMPPHSDFISTVAFNDNGQWIATGSYDKTINLLNMAIMKRHMKLRGHNSAIIKIIFLPEAKLLSVEKEGNLIVWDMRNGKVIKRLSKMNDEVTAMTISADKRFAFVGTKLGYVGLYDLQIMDQISYHYIKEPESITTLAFIDSPYRLAVGTAEGNIRIYSLFGNEENLFQTLREGQYKLFYEALEENPMLLYSKPYEAAERVWAEIIEKARVLLENNEQQKAKDLLNIFS